MFLSLTHTLVNESMLHNLHAWLALPIHTTTHCDKSLTGALTLSLFCVQSQYQVLACIVTCIIIISKYIPSSSSMISYITSYPNRCAPLCDTGLKLLTKPNEGFFFRIFFSSISDPIFLQKKRETFCRKRPSLSEKKNETINKFFDK